MQDNLLDQKIREVVKEERRDLRRKYFLSLGTIIAGITIIFLVWAQAQVPNPGHAASQVGPGTFSAGDYIIAGNLNVSKNLTVENITAKGFVKGQNICIGSDCRTSWPASSTNCVTRTYMNPNSALYSNVSCLSTEVVMGGGCRSAGGFEIDNCPGISTGCSTSANGWYCEFQNQVTNHESFVRCCS